MRHNLVIPDEISCQVEAIDDPKCENKFTAKLLLALQIGLYILKAIKEGKKICVLDEETGESQEILFI